jgi:hypothetical protein
MISNTIDLSDPEVVSHQESLKASADFSGQGEGVHPLAEVMSRELRLRAAGSSS